MKTAHDLVLQAKAHVREIAFIKFHWRVSAEFAREALDQQQLTGSTLHEVRDSRGEV